MVLEEPFGLSEDLRGGNAPDKKEPREREQEMKMVEISILASLLHQLGPDRNMVKVGSTGRMAVKVSKRREMDRRNEGRSRQSKME